MTEDSPNSPPELTEVERVALKLAAAHDAIQNPRKGYAVTSYRAGASVDYWDAQARAAIEALSSKNELPSGIEGLIERLLRKRVVPWAVLQGQLANPDGREAAQVILSLQRRLDERDAALEAVKERCFKADGDANWSHDILSIVVPIIDATLNPKDTGQ
jgi:hypothetical protein